MSERAFSVDEAVHNPTLYDVINTFEDDVPFWLGECRKAPGPVLELCCGTGRITVPLALQKVPVVGADISSEMLAGLRRRADRAGVSIPTARLDMRDFSLDRKFSLIFVPFNSFQCLYSLADIESALACIRRHLEPSGRFILDVFNPSLEIIVDRSRVEKRHEPLEVPGRGLVEWRESTRYDRAAQVTRVTWTFLYPDGQQEIQRLDMRCFFPQELELILKTSGFAIEERFGDFEGAPFRSDSSKQILVCRARE